MDYYLRAKLEIIDRETKEVCDKIYRYSLTTGSKILLDDLQYKLNVCYKNCIKKIIDEKRQLIDQQLKNYTDEQERTNAKIMFENQMKYLESKLNVEYSWE